MGPGSPGSAPSTTTETLYSYMATKNGGGDPVTALALRDESSEDSAAARNADVIGKLLNFSAQYGNGGSASA